MLIRFAQNQDIPRLIALLGQIGSLHAQGRPDIFRSDALKYDAPALEKLLLDPSRPIFVAVENDTVVGYCLCIKKVTQSDPVLAPRQELYINDLCVDETCRGKGIGKALYRHAVSYAKTEKMDALSLNVWAFNQNALEFYKAMGMQVRNMTMELPLEDTPC